MKIYSFSKKISLLILFASHSCLYTANIIFDLNGVLVKKHSITTLWQIGLWNLLGYYKPWNAEQYLFDFLDECEPRHDDAPEAEHNGRQLPQIMCDWLMGTKTCQEILQIVNTGIEENPEFFKTHCPKKLIAGTTNFMFTPERFIKAITVHKKGYHLFEKCRNLHYNSGQPVHRIFILSNWDAESFEHLKNKKVIGDMLAAADGVVISGAVGMMKPDPAIFEYLFNTYNIDPDNEFTVYIDDEYANIRAADALGKKQLYCLHCTSFNEIKKQLQAYRIIP